MHPLAQRGEAHDPDSPPRVSQVNTRLSLDLKRFISLRDRSVGTLLKQLQHLLVRKPHKRQLLPISSLKQIRPLITVALLRIFPAANQVLAGVTPLRSEPVPGARVSAVGQALEGQVEFGFDALGVAAVTAFVAAVFEVPFAGDGVESNGGETARRDATASLAEWVSGIEWDGGGRRRRDVYVGIPAGADCCCAAVLASSARHPESDVDGGDCRREAGDDAGRLHVGEVRSFVDVLGGFNVVEVKVG